MVHGRKLLALCPEYCLCRHEASYRTVLIWCLSNVYFSIKYFVSGSNVLERYLLVYLSIMYLVMCDGALLPTMTTVGVCINVYSVCIG